MMNDEWTNEQTKKYKQMNKWMKQQTNMKESLNKLTKQLNLGANEQANEWTNYLNNNQLRRH